MGMDRCCMQMEISTVGSGWWAKRKAGVFKSTRTEASNTRDSGKMTSNMGTARFYNQVDHISKASSKMA